MTDPALAAALNARMTGRAETTVERIAISDMKPVYWQVDERDGKPVRVNISYPAKYGDTSIGRLCDELTEQMNRVIEACLSDRDARGG